MRLLGSILIGLASAALGAGSASATNVYVNSPLVTSYTPTATVGGAKYRISNNSFDLSLDRGTDTSGGAGSFIQADLGTQATLNGIAYDFELEHIAGEGILFTMTPSAGGSATTLSWGTFSTPPPGTNAATLNGIAPGASFNSVQVTSVASSANRSVVLSNLVFSSALTLADGNFGASTTTNASSPATQLLVADVDLSQFGWNLTGQVTLTKQGTGGDETARIRFEVVDAIVTIIPEPDTAALLVVGLMGLALAGRNRKRRFEPSR